MPAVEHDQPRAIFIPPVDYPLVFQQLINEPAEINGVGSEHWNRIALPYFVHKGSLINKSELIDKPAIRSRLEEIIWAERAVHRLIDFCAGSGWMTKFVLDTLSDLNLVDQIKEVVLVDSSEDMLALASASLNSSKITFVHSSVSDPQLTHKVKANHYDLAISSLGLDCVFEPPTRKNARSTPQRALHNLFAVMKPRAHGIVSIAHEQRNREYATGSKDNKLPEGWYWEKWRGTGGKWVPRNYLTTERWRELFKKVGFSRVDRITPIAPNINEFIEHIRPNYPQGVIPPEAMKEVHEIWDRCDRRASTQFFFLTKPRT